ncbi:adenylyl-sulfate kinase [Rhodoferax sp. PAMC 29310]|uniref:adenylyl-sulfate kinase n=1 Tax=Rhodoferax sp. PAMC 29310 TaxID=2822760 RepID=UPI001F0A5669|nr:adenylyl-sulfate kinase [Rhodoferax sp. PAMC 29310]
MAQHEACSGHPGAVVWLTGLPGSGKSTLARAAQQNPHLAGFRTVLLDGDNLRHGLCSDLSFSVDDRNENVRRTGEVARLFLETGVVAIVALVSPMRAARDAVRCLLPEGAFFEMYCQCPVTVCRGRDPKGHYPKAEKGTISDFTGVSSPYEISLAPALQLNTGAESVEEFVERLTRALLNYLQVSA